MSNTISTTPVDINEIWMGRMSFDEVIGRRAVYTTFDGEKMVGTLERSRETSWTLVVRFDDGRWASCGDMVYLVNEA